MEWITRGSLIEKVNRDRETLAWTGSCFKQTDPNIIGKAVQSQTKYYSVVWKTCQERKKPRSSSERPRKIDNIGLENICSFKKDESDEHLNCLKRQIRLEAKETHERSNSAGNQLDYIKISKRTVGRYTKMVDDVQVTK